MQIREFTNCVRHPRVIIRSDSIMLLKSFSRLPQTLPLLACFLPEEASKISLEKYLAEVSREGQAELRGLMDHEKNYEGLEASVWKKFSRAFSVKMFGGWTHENFKWITIQIDPCIYFEFYGILSLLRSWLRLFTFSIFKNKFLFVFFVLIPKAYKTLKGLWLKVLRLENTTLIQFKVHLNVKKLKNTMGMKYYKQK